jgi:hypothetical protein
MIKIEGAFRKNCEPIGFVAINKESKIFLGKNDIDELAVGPEIDKAVFGTWWSRASVVGYSKAREIIDVDCRLIYPARFFQIQDVACEIGFESAVSDGTLMMKAKIKIAA